MKPFLVVRAEEERAPLNALGGDGEAFAVFCELSEAGGPLEEVGRLVDESEDG